MWTSSHPAQEEIVAPVLVPIAFDRSTAISRRFRTASYGLTASVFTHDRRADHQFARYSDAVSVSINPASTHSPDVPHGGLKDGVVGREESFDEVLACTQVKNVNVYFG